MGTFLEFFAGGGMARAGLGEHWECVFANDVDAKKADSYVRNWGDESFVLGDISSVAPSDIPGRADLAWASFPCQDLSLAGNGAGLSGSRSRTFWTFWELVGQLLKEQRHPKIVVLENVYGLFSGRGRAFHEISMALADGGYRFGVVVINAKLFVPQSRPRVFFIACHSDFVVPPDLLGERPQALWHTDPLIESYQGLPLRAKDSWVWWKLPEPTIERRSLHDILEHDLDESAWKTEQETQRLLSLMDIPNRQKLDDAIATGEPFLGTVYRRMRKDDSGKKVQRAEIRLDGIAGCLRTPSGGSSKQILLVGSEHGLRTRNFTPRETARLMGLAESYILPSNSTDALHLTGDGLVVPVVKFISENLLLPLNCEQNKKRGVA